MNNNCLILIDFINDIVDEKGKLSGKGYASYIRDNHTIRCVNNCIEMARKSVTPILFVKLGFSSDYHELPNASPLLSGAKKGNAFCLGSWGTEVFPEIMRVESDIVIVKHRVSAFFSTPLDMILRNMRIESIFVGGVATDLAVQSAVKDAHDRDYQVTVVQDMCAAANTADHENAIGMISKIGRVIRSTELESHLVERRE